MFVHRRGNSLD